MLKGISTVLRRGKEGNFFPLSDHIRCYKGSDRDKILVKASDDSIKAFKKKAKDIIRKYYSWNIENSITKLNHLINGTANYWKIDSNKRIFSKWIIISISYYLGKLNDGIQRNQ